MSKHQPNQDFYKIGGRSQTDGPDRGDSAKTEQPEYFQKTGKDAHPAVKRAAKRK
jgi:hypothetical protein